MFTFENQAPFSSTYQDIYFSPEHGLQESQHVFIGGNQLIDRWKDKNHFVIGETGFGTGLNFLATWNSWLSCGTRPQTLHYVSIEKHPLKADQLSQSHHLFPELTKLSNELVARYPVSYGGIHRIWLDNHRVCLTLCLEDVCQALENLEAKVDCWYLDGFAPSKNPEMWTSNVFRHLARLSNPGASIATFSAAGHVRRGLTDAGFNVTKVAGFGKKREMTVGTLETPPRVRLLEPWRKSSSAFVGQTTALVVGAGIAGAQVAWQLAQRGFTIEILERNSSAGAEASGNPRAIVSPKLSALPSFEEEFSICAYLAAISQLSQIAPSSSSWNQCGVLNLVSSELRLRQWKNIANRQLPSSIVSAVSAAEASEIAGIELSKPALYFPKGGWLKPSEIIQLLLNHSKISVNYSQEVSTIEYIDGSWIVKLAGGKEISTQLLVVASGSSLSQLTFNNFQVDSVAGQTTFAQSSDNTESLRCVIQHDGYVTPSDDKQHMIGATFDRGDNPTESAHARDERNFLQLKTHLPSFASQLGCLSTAHSAARITTKTRYPLVGAIPNRGFFSSLTETQRNASSDSQPYLPGLYMLGALGSRGFSSASLCAEILCSEILDEPSPVKLAIKRAIEPVRWVNH